MVDTGAGVGYISADEFKPPTSWKRTFRRGRVAIMRRWDTHCSNLLIEQPRIGWVRSRRMSAGWVDHLPGLSACI
jgi:hypothetical protein